MIFFADGYMQTFHNIASLIILFGAFLAFFSSLVFFKIKHGNIKANRFLSLFCFTTMAYLLRGFLLLNGFFTRFPLAVEFMDNMRYILGPALFFYIKTAIDPDYRFKKTDIFHLAPVMLNLIIRSPFYFIDTEYQVQHLTNWLDGPFIRPEIFWEPLSQVLFFGSFCFYIISSIRFHLKFKEKIRESSCFGPFYLSWIRIFTYALSLSLFIWVIAAIPVVLGRPLRYSFYSMNLLVSFLVFFCVMKIISWPEILFMAKPLKSRKKYNASYLTDREAELFLEKIKYLMEHKEEYIDPDLDLPKLAAQLSIPKNYLSQIINEKTGKSFNDFINHYRIEKIKAWFKDPARQNETILALAFEAGFNSKASFNHVFKKFTGESPITFRKKYIT